MKHMTNYVFNNAIKTIDDAIVKINEAAIEFLLILVTQTSRKGTITTFIEKSVLEAPAWHRLRRYEVVSLEDVLRLVCDDIYLLIACIDAGIVVPN